MDSSFMDGDNELQVGLDDSEVGYLRGWNAEGKWTRESSIVPKEMLRGQKMCMEPVQ